MSMLTPPGLGGKYRITGDKYPRMRPPRRRPRLFLTIAASVVVLGLVGWGTQQLIHVFSGNAKTATAAQGAKCRTAAGAPAKAAFPKPDQVTVNVYNATTRTGLAQETADQLKARGFVIGKVANAPAAYDKKLRGTGLLLGSAGGQKGAMAVLGTQVAGAAKKADTRSTGDVDLIIGDTFTSLTPAKDATTALAALSSPAVAKGCPQHVTPAVKEARTESRDGAYRSSHH
jgi:LytR cell envelope-related transcriptional attenuator